MSRMAMVPLRLPACCFVFLLGSLAFALTGPQQEQKPQQPATQQQTTPTFAVEAAMVVVDVSVRDSKGNLLPDLKREDFRIYEDNVPQSIITFAAEKVPIGSAPAEEAPVAEASKEKPPAPAPVVNLGLNPNQPVKKEVLSGKRLMILFFDLSSLGTEDLMRSAEAARQFIAKQTGPQDLMAVATYSSTLELVQDFTNDRDVLLKTLDSISSTESDVASEDLSDASTSDEIYVPDTVQFNIFNTDRRLSALETLAKMYREFPERKSLIYFSSGVSTTGVENNAQIRSTVDSANRSNMSIYTVDSRGLIALPPGGDASQRSAGSAMFNGGAMGRQRDNLMSSQETLITLSHDTGGKAFTDSNDLGVALNQVQKDTNVYYVLGYFSSNSKEDGKYRKIRIELARPGLKIEHRPGYFASKAFKQLNQQERDLQLQQAMSVDRPFVDVPLILEVDYFRKDDKTTLVPISMELDGDGLKFEEKGVNRESKFEFVAQATDAKGKVASVARDVVQLRLPADKAEKIKAGGIFYSTGFELRPGDYKLKFLVRDNVSGKLGSFEQPIQVPNLDLKKLNVSSIVLGSQLASTIQRSDSGVTHQGAMRRFQALMTGYDPLVLRGRKVVPSIGNVFLAGQTVYVYFQVYGAAEDKESQKPHVEADLMLIRGKTKIIETQPQYVQQWTPARNGPFFGARGFGNMNRGTDGSQNGAAAGPPRGSGGPPEGRGGMGFPGGGRMGGPPGMQMNEDRKGEATIAISLPLKNLKRGTYTLQIHIRDTVADVNRFERVPIVIQ